MATHGKSVMVYLPSIVHILIQESLPPEVKSVSQYVRNLIYADLKQKDLLKPEIMEQIIVGTNGVTAQA